MVSWGPRPASTYWLVRAVRARGEGDGLVIIDAPPGTSCPVVAAVRGADTAVLVTEPTPFGLHDLELAVEAVRRLRVPFGVVVNRADGDRRVQHFCLAQRLPLLAELPDDRRVAETYAHGDLMFNRLPEWRELFTALWQQIESQP